MGSSSTFHSPHSVSPQSMKKYTCYFYDQGHCKYREDQCLYSHNYYTTRVADGPVQTQAGRMIYFIFLSLRNSEVINSPILRSVCCWYECDLGPTQIYFLACHYLSQCPEGASAPTEQGSARRVIFQSLQSRPAWP